MRRFLPLLLATLACVALPRPSAAADRGAFVFTLGSDTMSAEHYTRSKARLEVEQVGRAPRLLRRSFRYDYASGALAKFSMIVIPPDANAPTQVVEAVRDGDSLRLTTKTGPAAPVASAIALPGRALLVPGSSPAFSAI